MTSCCSLYCSHPAESRLAFEFRPNLSFFLGIAEQLCLSLSSWLHSYFLLPNSWSFVLSLCFYPALFCFLAPLRHPLLPSFLSSLDYLLSCLDQRCKPWLRTDDSAWACKTLGSISSPVMQGRKILGFLLGFLWISFCFNKNWCSIKGSIVEAGGFLWIIVLSNITECRCVQ